MSFNEVFKREYEGERRLKKEDRRKKTGEGRPEKED